MNVDTVPGRLQSIMRVGGWIGFVTIIIISLVPGSYRPHTGEPGQMEHFAAYFLTALALGSGYSTSLQRIAICITMSVASGLFEIMQLWIPGRSGQVIDCVASSSGSFSGIIFAWLFWRLIDGTPKRRPLVRAPPAPDMIAGEDLNASTTARKKPN